MNALHTTGMAIDILRRRLVGGGRGLQKNSEKVQASEEVKSHVIAISFGYSFEDISCRTFGASQFIKK